MSKQPLTISEEAKVQMPMKTVASLITLVAIGTWAFFGIQEKLNTHATKLQIMEKDLEMNSEFCSKSFSINSKVVVCLLRVSWIEKNAQVPIATSAMRLATVFIGI